ncbi:MAG TPA: DUF349 domain-containing protein [Marinagarivorans sp.]
MIPFFSRLFKKAPSATPHSKPSSNNAQNRTSEAAKPAADRIPTHYGPELLSLARAATANKQRTAARQRIATLLEAGQLTLAQVTADARDTDELLALCSFDATAASEILSTIDDQHALASMANEAATAPVRKAAADRVTQRDALEAMLKGAKGKDKNVYKIAKNQLAVYKAEDDALAQRQEHLASICTDAERHAKKSFDHLYSHKFVSLEQQWQAHEADATPELQARFDAAIAQCQKIIDAEVAKSKAAALAEQIANSAVQGIESATEATTALAGQLYACNAPSEDDFAQYRAKLSEQTARVQRQIADAQASTNKSHDQQMLQQQAQQTFYQVAEAVNALIKLMEQDGSLSQLVASLADQDAQAAEQTCSAISAQLNMRANLPNFSSDLADRAETSIADWQREQKEKTAKRKALIGNLSDLIRRANIAANSGQVRRARGIAKEIDEKRQHLANMPVGLANKLEQLDQTIAKLGDWHDFAVTPKKQALVEKMTALQNSELAPDDLADKIHELQDEWKLLCKGGQNQDEELWQAFQNSADIAFEPCKKHFAEQAEMREKKATERRELIAQLEQYHDAYDWDKAIWKDVEQTLRVAKDTWKTLWPVPRQQQKDLQGAFDATLDKIYAHMNEAYELGKQKKEQLIALAEKAAQHNDPKQAAEEIKQLQTQWKDAGRTFRKAEQQLWTQFRSICDEVFNKRQAVFDEANAERDQLAAQASALIAKLRAIAEQTGEQLQSQHAEIAELKAAFDALGELPKNEHSLFSKQLKTIDEKIAAHRTAAHQQAWENLLSASAELNAIENTIASGNNATQALAAFKESAGALKLPSGCGDILLPRINAAEAGDIAQDQHSEKALRLLCIRAEIAKGIESPEQDKTLRMNYQVEALKENFGSSQVDSTESLTKAWVGIGNCPADTLQSLQARFVASAFDNAKISEKAVVEPA